MANATGRGERGAAQVDFLVDENGSRVELPDDSTVKVAGDADKTVGATGPTNWWRIGLVMLAILVLLLLALQIFGGGPPTTNVVPGTPVTAPAAPAQ